MRAEKGLYELSLLYGIFENPFLTDKQKIHVGCYIRYALSMKKRNDGYFYYSCYGVARLMGGKRVVQDQQCAKEQAFHPIHVLLQEHGYIHTITQQQKKDETKQVHFDKCLPPLFYTRSINLGSKKGVHGGKRTAVHKECGGECQEEITYCCKRCGEIHISQSNVFFIDSEEIERKPLPTMEEIEQWHIYDDASDIRDADLAYLEDLGLVNEYGVIVATDKEIAQILNRPVHIREGLCDEDLDLVNATLDELSRLHD